MVRFRGWKDYKPNGKLKINGEVYDVYLSDEKIAGEYTLAIFNDHYDDQNFSEHTINVNPFVLLNNCQAFYCGKHKFEKAS